MITNIFILGTLILLSAFFSAAEVAFVSLTDAKVSAMVKRGTQGADLVKKLKGNSRRLLITILVGNNVVNITAASFATLVATNFFASSVLGITTGVMTLLILIFGEILPKSFAGNHPRRIATFSAPFLWFVGIVGYPVVITFEWLSNIATGKQKTHHVSEEELQAMAMAGAIQGTIEHEEGLMIERLFQFNDITAEDVMTPRVDVEFIDRDMSFDMASDIIEKHPFTRFPVIDGTPDNVIGFVHSRDVLLALNHDHEARALGSIIRPIVQVPKQLPIDDLLKEFQKKKTHMAIVMDEYGGTEGIATLEDVIEELVGEIIDEHDIDEQVIKRIDKKRVLVAGDTEIRDIEVFCDITLPGGQLDTIAEVILDHLKKIPRKNMTVTFENGVTATLAKVEKGVIVQAIITKE